MSALEHHEVMRIHQGKTTLRIIRRGEGDNVIYYAQEWYEPAGEGETRKPHWIESDGNDLILAGVLGPMYEVLESRG